MSVALFQSGVKKMDRERGGGARWREGKGALSGEGQRVKPMGILGNGPLPKRW